MLKDVLLKFDIKLERLAVMPEKEKSTLEHVLNTQNLWRRKVAAKNDSSWKGPRRAYARICGLHAGSAVVYSELRFRAVGVPRQCLVRDLFG